MSISVEEYAKRCQLTAEEVSALQEIISNPETMKMAQEIADRCFIPEEKQPAPEFPDTQQHSQAWFAAAFLSAEAAEKHFEKLGFPKETLFETMTDIGIWLRNCKRNYGYYGIYQARDWQASLYHGAVTRHGRLECNTDYTYRYDDLTDESGRVILTRGDKVINLHIPEDGKMDIKLCSISLRRISSFFAEYLPNYNWKGFFCESWLLDPQLKAMVPENSNIRKFQSFGYQFPLHESDAAIFRIFGTTDPQKVENPSYLLRKAAEFLKSGGKFASAGFFVPRENIQAVNFDLERLIKE